MWTNWPPRIIFEIIWHNVNYIVNTLEEIINYKVEKTYILNLKFPKKFEIKVSRLYLDVLKCCSYS